MRSVFKAALMAVLICTASLSVLFIANQAFAKGPAGSDGDQVAKFRQLRTELRSPNMYRGASGAPGPAYWQQQADHKIDVRLDEDKRRLTGAMTVTYTNNSPDTLSYIWMALDQNRFKDGSLARMSEVSSAVGTRNETAQGGDSYSFSALRRQQGFEDRKYGFEFASVTYADGSPLDYIVNDTMMRLDLKTPLKPGQRLTYKINWAHNITDHLAVGGRGGFETGPDDENDIFAVAQWFPRLAAYTDYTGWQNKQFLGRGEFTLEFGNYDVSITVPADHIVAATGVLQNPKQVLTAIQRERLAAANEDAITFIVTPEEAAENERGKLTTEKTWRFKAEKVRDFSWSSSRKYIWDAMQFKQDDDKNPVVLAMSFYPNDAEPIWSKFSTQAVVHTMDVYNRFAFNYPYPVAQSVNGWARGGMEYPMITFNGYRPTKDEKTGDKTYSRNTKYGLVGVVIHEIGHIYFPMTVNSDERRWTWMDEGINTFLEYLAEYEWEENFPIRGNMQNPLDQITGYMSGATQVPIMTQSDSVLSPGNNAYAKPAAALIILRETVMGRELFDKAFREYATRWKFKRPTPEDFFRTMEDASAVDLDWFWRGWFFGTDHVDMGIAGVREYTISTGDPDIEEVKKRQQDIETYPENIVQRRNRDENRPLRVDRFKDLNDLYNENDKFTTTNKDRNKFKDFMEKLEDWERDAYDRAMKDGQYLYFIDFENIGGLISPLPLTLTYVNGTTEDIVIPAEIWRKDSAFVTKLLVRKTQIKSIALDPAHQTADADYNNNFYPPQLVSSRLELYKSKGADSSLMKDMLVELKKDKAAPGGSGKSVPLAPSSEAANGSPAAGESQRALTPKQQDLIDRTVKRMQDADAP